MKKKKLKKYKLKVDGIQDPMNLISVVQDPAIEQKGIFFSKQNDSKKINLIFNNDNNFKFNFNEYEGILIAPAMIPDIEIYRYNEIDGEYFVQFSKETIQLISEKFNENYNGKRINFNHSNEMTDGVIIESWIKEDEEFDKSNKYFDLKVGTWFLKIKFNDKEFFKKYIVEKQYSGLSIELIESFMEFDEYIEIEVEEDFNNQKFESYNDYPQVVKDNAQRAIDKNLELGNKCATQVGKIRAQQLVNGENLSIETIKRTYSYLSRAKEYDNNDWESCGTISYNLWGGDEMLSWVERKLENIDKEMNDMDVEKYVAELFKYDLSDEELFYEVKDLI